MPIPSRLAVAEWGLQACPWRTCFACPTTSRKQQQPVEAGMEFNNKNAALHVKRQLPDFLSPDSAGFGRSFTTLRSCGRQGLCRIHQVERIQRPLDTPHRFRLGARPKMRQYRRWGRPTPWRSNEKRGNGTNEDFSRVERLRLSVHQNVLLLDQWRPPCIFGTNHLIEFGRAPLQRLHAALYEGVAQCGQCQHCPHLAL